MSNKEKVQSWRKRTKDRIVRAFGSKCTCCGYDRCQEALQFHHIDPSTKEHTISSMTTNIKSWDRIIEEARKCIMVCGNCHAEIHAGLRNVPIDATTFDEAFADYKKTDFGEQIPCPVCGNKMPSNQTSCSNICASKKSNTIVWDDKTITERYLNGESLTSIGKSFSVSSSAVGKRLKKIGVR